jgi:glyoxylase-like metal-dependent hydrolase (beta-lactamase superfamily II)/ferredoxin
MIDMALIKLRRKENISGDFFVDSTCIDCDLCRQIAPETFADIGDQSAVFHQPSTHDEEMKALKALVACPTASIGASGEHPVKAAVAAFPDQIENEVYFCGFAAESSFGASSYLILRPEGNVLVDSPRFARPLVEKIASMGGIRTIFLTHRDDVADFKDWSRHFNADRIMHNDDMGSSHAGVERVLTGQDPVKIDKDLVAIPTPGHTRGHMVLLYRDRYLFSGDHLWWSVQYQALNASRSVCWYSWPKQTESMERLMNYNFEWVLPGHGRRAHASASEMRKQLIACIERMKGKSSTAAD